MRTIFVPFGQRECCMLGTPSSQPTVLIHELPPAMLVIHRQTSAHELRKWTRSVQSRLGILAYLCTRQHWLWITVELHITACATGRLLLGREVATLLYAEFWARNHYVLECIDIVVNDGRSGVPLSSTRLPQQRSDSNFARGLVFQAGHRDTLCKNRHQPTRPHGHVSGPLVKFDMGHCIRRGP